MAYHLYIFNLGLERMMNAVCKSFEAYFQNKAYAANAVRALEQFDAKAVLEDLHNEILDKAKYYISYPPKDLQQIPYIRIVTSFDMASKVIPGAMSIAAKRHLVMYDDCTKNIFNPDQFMNEAFISSEKRAKQINKAIRQKWQNEEFWRFSHVYSSQSTQKATSYYVVVIKKQKEKGFCEKIKEFCETIEACLLPNERLICDSKCFIIDGEKYAIVYYLEGYKRANLLGYMENGEPKVSLMHRMGYWEMAKWLAKASPLEREDTLSRLEFNEMKQSYEDMLDRLAASIKLTKKLEKLPCCVGIGSIEGYRGDNLCFHVLPTDYSCDKGNISMLRIEEIESLAILQFIDDICPYIRERFYDETYLPIEYLKCMAERIKEIRAVIIQNPYDDLNDYYCTRNAYSHITSAWIAENKTRVIKLFDVFIEWAEQQDKIYGYGHNRMFSVSGP